HAPALTLAGEIELRLGNLGAAELNLTQALKLQPSLPVQRMLAATYLRQNRPGKAIDVLQTLLREPGPKDAGLLMQAGEAYLANGDARRAAEYFEASKSAGSNEGTVRTRLGQLALVQGDFDRSVAELQVASTLLPQKVEPDLLLFSLHQRRNEPAKALAAAQSFIKKQPQNPLGYVLAGTAQMAQRDLSGARKSFDEALKIAPDHVPALRGLAQLDLTEGRPAEALQRYDAAPAGKPNDDQLLVAVAELQERTGRVEEAGKTLRKAVAANPKAQAPVVALVRYHLRRKDPASALAVAREAVLHNPEELNLVVLLSLAQEAAGSDKEAIRTLTALIVKEPQAVAPMVKLAQLQAKQRDFDGAVATLLRAQAKAPESDEVAHELVAVYLRSGKTDQALNVARDLQSRRPNSAAGHVLEGDVRAFARKLPEAESAYRAGLKLDPRNGAAAVKIYRLYIVAGGPKEAAQFAADWTARNPTDVPMRLIVADATLKANDLPGARQKYEEVLRIDPNNVLALNNLAWVLGQLKDPQAIPVAERATALAPNSADVLDTLGMLHVQSGDAKTGLEMLERARQADPDRLDLRLHYAIGLLQNGRTQEGKSQLRELAAAKADFPGKADIPALLAKQ
ncbi:MAG TPA: XrtA/PEP-CTERM system TPR-repeat protein PrsT, partial [Burkholderiaceae bacterium]|nr:XrtA/PEP-CTERM system TPR-repeat protein PrsT [Burkholderiaceae bacterium]